MQKYELGVNVKPTYMTDDTATNSKKIYIHALNSSPLLRALH